MLYSSNFVFISEKKIRIKGRQPFITRFVSGPCNRLKNLSAAVTASRSATRILLRGRGFETKPKFFCTKIVWRKDTKVVTWGNPSKLSGCSNHVLKQDWKRTPFKRYITVTAPIYFICPVKFSNSALLFGSYFCCVSLRVIVFFNFRTFRSTPNFRRNAQLFRLFAEF